MRRLGSASTWLIALYPADWRARYGAELRALIEEEPATPSIVLDVLRGALDAHASPLPAGGFPMRSRAMAATSVVALLLVLPAVTLLAAGAVRLLQPPQHQPAQAADALFEAFAALGPGWFWALIGLAPLAALGLSVFVAWRRLASDPAAREDLGAFAQGLRRIAHQPTLVVAAFALLASAAVLVFAIDHWIAG
jgi:hypothetical protein